MFSAWYTAEDGRSLQHSSCDKTVDYNSKLEVRQLIYCSVNKVLVVRALHSSQLLMG